ncbi:MAG: 4Fe-4S binding protein [Austwickia sp.]|nr:4Fe-4S binding protein [Austwickia sp.]MBK8437566.1 4Fe-4S binding protein [Austwickia sp.]MBK9102832.1 4Fe-4S binding protein [Austwickia sp.]
MPTPVSIDNAPPPRDHRRRPQESRSQQRRRSVATLRRWRYLSQLAVAVLILVAAVRHQLARESGAPSTDALCPFGGVETLWTWVTTGEFISKVHPSNMILGAAVAVSVLVAGNAFCGWICPFGSLQDLITGLRAKLGVRAWSPSPAVDRVLRAGRYVVLLAVVVASAVTASLIFAHYDPYVTLFSLHWLFEPDLATMWPALVILTVVLIGSVLVDRFWCRYLCPAGAVFAVLGHLSFLRIRRTASACTDCRLCNTPCPVGIDVAGTPSAVSTDCIGCLECVANCTFGGALEVSGPTWVGSIGRRTSERDTVLS